MQTTRTDARNTAQIPEHRAVAQASGNLPSSQLRVALFTNSVAIGGMEKHVEMIANDLDRAQVEVFAVVPKWKPIEAWSSSFKEMVDHVVEITPDRRYGLVAFLRETLRLARQRRQWRIDVLHMHLTRYEGGVAALLAARLARVPVVMVTEHLAPEAPLPFRRRIIRNLTTRNFNRVVCVSVQGKHARETYLYTPAEKTSVVNNGIEITPFDPTPDEAVATLRAELKIPASAPIVGTVVRFVDEKGLNYLLDAMPRILEGVPGTYLLMVGDGPLHAALQEQASALGISDRVIFAGFQSDPRPYLSLMNAFVLPVPFGSASIGLLEAMAMRRAVVITFGGEGEPVIHGATGLQAPPRDASALAEAILQVIRSPEYERELGHHARRRIEEAFSSQGVATQLLALYRHELHLAGKDMG